MKKVIFLSLLMSLILPVTIFAEQNGENDTSTATQVPPVVIAYDGVCASKAVIAHEDAQQAIVKARQSSMNSAAVIRRDSLAAAYLLTDKTARDLAIKAAFDIFMTTQKASEKTAKEASMLENKSFMTAMMACGVMQPPKNIDQMGNGDGSDENTDIGNTQDFPGQNGLNKGKGNKFGIIKNMLRHGSKGEDVKRIQEILGLTADGVFGPWTEAKVKEWQAKNGLSADGIVGEKSIIELEKEEAGN